MKLIAKTRIGSFPLCVYETREVKGDGAYGVTFRSENGKGLAIYLDPDSSPAVYWETFWHELAHAFCIAYGIRWRHDHIHAFGVGMSEMFRGFQWATPPSHALPRGLAGRPKRRA